MTSENSFNEEFEQAAESYRNTWLQPLNGFNVENRPMPTELIPALKERDWVNSSISQLNSVKIQQFRFDPVTKVREHYTNLESQQEAQRQSILHKYDDMKQQALSQHEADKQNAAQHNADLLVPIKKKHEELLEMKDDCEKVFKHYDITPLDVDVSDKCTFKEFSLLIRESIKVCKKYMRKSDNRVHKILSPLKGEKNLQFTFCYILLLLVGVYFLLPIMAVPAFIVLFMSTHNMYKDLEKLRIACSLMSQIDYERFVDPDEKIDVESDIDTSEYDERCSEELSALVDYSDEKQAAIADAERMSNEYAEKSLRILTELKTQYANVIGQLESRKGKLEELIADLKSKLKVFPENQNLSVVMSHSYVLGKLHGSVDVTITYPNKNIVFDNSDHDFAISTMKLFLANAILSVRVKQLSVEIYDPVNMCSDFTEFFTVDTKAYITANSKALDTLIDEYRAISQVNIIDLDSVPIDTFNEDAEKRELVSKPYKILILVSDLKHIKEGDKSALFKEYMKYSADSGVMIWLLDTEKYDDALWISKDYYTAEGEPIKYTRELGKKAVETYSVALAKFKDTGIDYVTKFGDVYIPREKWWTFDTIHGIQMPYGLEKGDPTRGLNVAPVIGDANVHALLGGATGAGKSAAINQLLISLITMYPPSELMIVYIDFKNVEAAKFTKGYDSVEKEWLNQDTEQKLKDNEQYYERISRIPHLRIISGTTDGEYALSVFAFLMDEMARRQKIINKFGVTKVEEMRNQILAKYNLEHNGDKKKGTWAEMRKDWDWYKPNVYDKYGDLPRLLVIFDEFQVMYNTEFVPQKVIDQINGKITAFTKLARAMAAHFWFTSQSMKGTMSKDTMSNFSLRGALRCSAEVSSELIGNPAAGTITAKFGFMYTNDSAGENKDANRLWRVPFLDEKKMPDYINPMYEMLEEFNEQHNMAVFYDEKVLVPIEELDSWYKKYPEQFEAQDVFILGERANFSTNKAPISTALTRDTNENIMAAGFEKNDMMNLVMLFVRNIQNSPKASFIINVQDAETYELLDVEAWADPRFASLASPKQDVEEFLNAIEAAINGRLQRADTDEFDNLYIILVQWERAPYVSVGASPRAAMKIKELMRDGPTVGVHFIFVSKEKLDMPREIPRACNHRVGALLTKDAMFFIETEKVTKLPDATKDAGLFAFYEFGTTLEKFRIYQNKFTKTIKSRAVVLE